MPYQMKGGQWRGVKMIAGVRRTKTFATKKKASAWESGQTAEEWAKQEQPINTVYLADVATAYLDYVQARYVKKTYDAKKLALKRLFAKVKDTVLPEKITPQTALLVLTGVAKTVTNAAANKDRKHLSAFWEFGEEFYQFPETNPFQAVKRLPEDKHHHYVPPLEDFWAVYNAADDIDKVLLLFILHTGARRSENWSLRWAEDIDFRKRRIRLTTGKTKDGSKKHDWLCMTNSLHTALANHRMQYGRSSEFVFFSKTTGEPYKERKKLMPALCRRAGVKAFGYHGIRGLTATVLAQDNVPVKEIQKILRHSNINTTDLYIRSLGITSDRLSSVFDKIEIAPKVTAFRAIKSV